MIYLIWFVLGFVVGNLFLVLMIKSKKNKVQKLKNKSKFQKIIEQSKDL